MYVAFLTRVVKKEGVSECKKMFKKKVEKD